MSALCRSCGGLRPCSCPYDSGRRIPFCAGAGDPDVTHRDWLAARSIAREHMPVEAGDKRRWEHDADRIRRALALPSYAQHTIEVACFNAQDVEAIKRRLTQDELRRVRFVI